MGLETLYLRNFLQITYADTKLRRTLLRRIIGNDFSKQNGIKGSGGDFYVPFWTDAKNHIKGLGNLHETTKGRIEKNKGRKRLYPLLEEKFLEWWNENRRWRNEEFTLIDEPIRARFKVPGINLTLKVENLVAVHVGGRFDRIVYPYFFEAPRLSPEACRIGLWVLDQSLTKYGLENMRILDVLGARAYGAIDYQLIGNEEDLLASHFRSMQSDWSTLVKERES